MWVGMMCTISFQFQWHLHTNHLPQACSSTHLPSSHAYTSLFSYPAQYNSKWRNANGLCSKHQHLGKKGNEFSFGSMPNPLGFLYGVEQCERSCKTGMLPSRREGLLSLVLLAGSISLEERNAGAQGEKGVLSLERYSDEKEGAGATVLFEDPEAKANNVGVVVNPVRISSLKEFGTVHDVADKLLQAEKNKPSTNDAQLIRVEERPIHGDIPLYKLEYTLDSTRGIKRILSAVIVASKKLYLLK